MISPLQILLGIPLVFVSPLLADTIQLVPQPNNPDSFMGIQTTGVIRPVALYTLGGMPWATTGSPLTFEPAAILAAQGNENPFLQQLNLFGNGWTFTFNTDVNLADNTFQVHTYDPQGPFPPRANTDAFLGAADENNPDNFFTRCGTNNNCVGEELYFGYNPTGSDPTNNVHWIQVVFDNFENEGAYTVDNGGGAAPYYGGAANTSAFLDIPAITGPDSPHTFDALLLLTTGPATPGTVTIYGGFEWGWSNTPVPEPSTLVSVAAVLLLLLPWIHRTCAPQPFLLHPGGREEHPKSGLCRDE